MFVQIIKKRIKLQSSGKNKKFTFCNTFVATFEQCLCSQMRVNAINQPTWFLYNNHKNDKIIIIINEMLMILKSFYYNHILQQIHKHLLQLVAKQKNE